MWMACSPGGKSCRLSSITMPSLSYIRAEPTLLPCASFSSTPTLAALDDASVKTVSSSTITSEVRVFITEIIAMQGSRIDDLLVMAFSQLCAFPSPWGHGKLSRDSDEHQAIRGVRG